MVKRMPKAADAAELTEDNISHVEMETMEKVSRTITVLEGALATWNASKDKPEEMKPKFSRYKKFHDALIEWETKALKAQAEEESFDNKIDRLQQFVDICYTYA